MVFLASKNRLFILKGKEGGKCTVLTKILLYIEFICSLCYN